MSDWNAVVTVREGGFATARVFLSTFGQVRKTDYLNTLVMAAADPFQLLAKLQDQLAGDPAIAAWLSRFIPLHHRFSYQSADEFEQQCREAVVAWLPRLANARFHVRMHRRGFKGRLSSMQEERFLDEFILDQLIEGGTPGKVAFNDPDAVIALETIGPQAGISLFSREELQRFSLLHID